MAEPLKIKSNDGFLHLEDLPHNCIFNKVVTGCGGTTVVLQNTEDYVIAVPTTELIINKTDITMAGISKRDYNGIRPFGLFGRFDDAAERKLKDYLNCSGIKKIMCTYDKVPKLMEYITPSSNELLVDEYQCLLKAYSYRQKAIDGVLDNFRAFKSFCFMSATPILPSFKPNCLADVKEIQAKWDKKYVDTLKVELRQTNKPYSMAANIINDYRLHGFYELNGHKSTEAFFFINSVRDIASILKHCNLSNDEVRIICADNNENREKLIGYDISNSHSDNKMFNFITSKSFEGVDYHSETGICFVVSSSSNPHTQASIDTDIPQIAGRIRTKDNPFRNHLVHIFNTTYKKLNLDMTYEQMKAKTEASIRTAYETVDFFNHAPTKAIKDNLRENLKHDLNSLYMKYDKQNDEFIINDILPKLELYNFQINQEIYKNGASVARAYEEIGTDVRQDDYKKLDTKVNFADNKISFKDAFLKYAELINDNPHSPALLFLEQLQPLVKVAYEKLGVEKVRSLRYVKRSIEVALKSLDEDKTMEQKLAMMMVGLIPTGTTITVAFAHKLMEQAYH